MVSRRLSLVGTLMAAMDGGQEKRRRGHGWPFTEPAMDGRRRKAAQQPTEQAQHGHGGAQDGRSQCPSGAPAMDGRENRGAMDGDHDVPRAVSEASYTCQPRSALRGENGFLGRLSLLPGPASRVKEVCFPATHLCRRQSVALDTASGRGCWSNARDSVARLWCTAVQERSLTRIWSGAGIIQVTWVEGVRRPTYLCSCEAQERPCGGDTA